MKYTVKLMHRNVPEKVLLDDLRKTAKKLGKKHISRQQYINEGQFHPSTFAKRFGSWNEALLKAGLKVKFIEWIPDDELLRNLKMVWDTLGRQPKWEEMLKPLSTYCRSAYAKHFGSWQRALLALEKAIRNGKFKSSKKADEKKLKNIQPKGKPKCKSSYRSLLAVSKTMRYDVFKRDNFKCRLCGASPAIEPKVTLHADHIKPASKGGETILSNLQTLCSDCNYGKGAKSINN